MALGQTNRPKRRNKQQQPSPLPSTTPDLLLLLLLLEGHAMHTPPASWVQQQHRPFARNDQTHSSPHQAQPIYFARPAGGTAPSSIPSTWCKCYAAASSAAISARTHIRVVGGGGGSKSEMEAGSGFGQRSKGGRRRRNCWIFYWKIRLPDSVVNSQPGRGAGGVRGGRTMKNGVSLHIIRAVVDGAAAARAASSPSTATVC